MRTSSLCVDVFLSWTCIPSLECDSSHKLVTCEYASCTNAFECNRDMFKARPQIAAIILRRAGTFVPASYQQDYGLNLSISLSPGKESNSNSHSRGDRTGNSPTPNWLVQVVVTGVSIYGAVWRRTRWR